MSLAEAFEDADTTRRRADHVYKARLLDDGPDHKNTKEARAKLETALAGYTNAKMDLREERVRLKRAADGKKGTEEPAAV